MTFEDKVKFLKSHSSFKVVQLSEIRGVAFSVKETEKPSESQYVLGKLGSVSLVLNTNDIEKIVRAYPDLASKLA